MHFVLSTKHVCFISWNLFSGYRGFFVVSYLLLFCCFVVWITTFFRSKFVLVLGFFGSGFFSVRSLFLFCFPRFVLLICGFFLSWVFSFCVLCCLSVWSFHSFAASLFVLFSGCFFRVARLWGICCLLLEGVDIFSAFNLITVLE